MDCVKLCIFFRNFKSSIYILFFGVQKKEKIIRKILSFCFVIDFYEYSLVKLFLFIGYQVEIQFK